MKMNKLIVIGIILILFSCEGIQDQPKPIVSKVPVDEWAKNSSIYEVNIRQYTPQGDFQSFLPYLENIKALGSDILWLMPIHPIGEKNRKGTMGSYYAVKDYKTVNPEFGTKEDFRQLVQQAHDMGFKVILDWVANHTAWDHRWVDEHPDFYTSDSAGNRPIVPEGTDWTDVADLNYDNPELHMTMIDAMQYWVEEFDIDGYRCDVAGFVPMEFWNKAVDSLNQIKPVFMLAEWDEPKMHNAFHMTYAWDFHHQLKEIAENGNAKEILQNYFDKEWSRYPEDAFRMVFTTNHDENSWNKTVFERYGEDLEPLTVLTFTVYGMPLVYSGQEVGMDKALRFFDKDTIPWKKSKWEGFYTKLLDLQENTEALWNAEYGARAEWLDSPEDVVAYKRIKDGEGVIVYLNFGGSKKEIEMPEKDVQDYMQSEGVNRTDRQLSLPAKAYYIGQL